MNRKERLTGEIPRLNLVEIDVDHGRAAAGEAEVAADLGRQVVADELVVPRVEPEPRRQPRLHHVQEAHRHDDGRSRWKKGGAPPADGQRGAKQEERAG
jgi:hypothetical protein